MTTPTPGSTLTSGTVTFNWTAGAGASAYWLDVGSTAGGNQYYQSGNLGNVLTTTVSGLPTDGSTIYVTLYSLIGAQLGWERIHLHRVQRNQRPGCHADADSGNVHQRKLSDVHLESGCERDSVLGGYQRGCTGWK